MKTLSDDEWSLWGLPVSWRQRGRFDGGASARNGSKTQVRHWRQRSARVKHDSSVFNPLDCKCHALLFFRHLPLSLLSAHSLRIHRGYDATRYNTAWQSCNISWFVDRQTINRQLFWSTIQHFLGLLTQLVAGFVSLCPNFTHKPSKTKHCNQISVVTIITFWYDTYLNISIPILKR